MTDRTRPTPSGPDPTDGTTTATPDAATGHPGPEPTTASPAASSGAELVPAGARSTGVAGPGAGVLVRGALHLALSAVPLLAIAVHVFGWVSMRSSTALVLVPLIGAVVMMSLFAAAHQRPGRVHPGEGP